MRMYWISATILGLAEVWHITCAFLNGWHGILRTNSGRWRSPSQFHEISNLNARTRTFEEELNGKYDVSDLVCSVNYFISRECNYNCKFCFHTKTNKNKFQFEQGRYGLQILKAAGTQKINFAGGEPFLNPELLGELCRVASAELGMAVSIISNGYMITPKWMNSYGKFVDVLGVSVDSFNSATNAAIGRGGNANNKHAERVLKVQDMCSQNEILFKMNTVVCSLNWEEDMKSM